MKDITLIIKFFLGRMRRLFFMSYPESNLDYRKSRGCFTVADSTAQVISGLAGGTYLVMLMTSLGISDGNMGIISTFMNFAGLAQIISIKLSNRIKKNKLFILITVLPRYLLAFIYFIPLLDIREQYGRLLLVVCYCFSCISTQIGAPAMVDWLASLVPAKGRGRYFSIKDSVSVIVVVTVNFVMGVLIDLLKTNYFNLALILLGSTIGIMSTVSVVALVKMKEPKLSHINENGQEMMGRLAAKRDTYHEKPQKVKLLKELKTAFGTVKFRNLVFFMCLQMTASSIAAPFNDSYKINYLKLSYTFIMLVSLVFTLLRAFVGPKAGKLVDRIGMTRAMSWGLLTSGTSYLVLAFTTPENAYLMTVLATACSVLGSIFTGITMLGIQLESVESEKRIIQFAILTITSGIYGFFVTVLGGKLIDFLQLKQISIAGHAIYAQQCTNVLGFIFILVTIGYLKKRIQISG